MFARKIRKTNRKSSLLTSGIESLEKREMMAADFQVGFEAALGQKNNSANVSVELRSTDGVEEKVLTIRGTSSDDRVYVDGPFSGEHDISINGDSHTIKSGQIDVIVFEGQPGNDRMVNNGNIRVEAYGGAGDDYLSGGRGDDVIDGGDGQDFVKGGLGQDVLMGSEGVDVIMGGGGDDEIFGGGQQDEIWGASGLGEEPDAFAASDSDRIYGAGRVMDRGSNDQVLGTPGSARKAGGSLVIDGSVFADQINVHKQDDSVVVTVNGQASKYDDIAVATINGHAGRDNIWVDADLAMLQVNSGSGDDKVTVDEANLTFVRGGSGDDFIRNETSSPAYIWGGEGSDTMYGSSLSWLYGEDGNDDIQLTTPYEVRFDLQPNGSYSVVETDDPSNGSAFVFGGEGDDEITAHNANYAVHAFGEGGRDTIIGSPLADSLIGGDGRDRIEGRAGDDTIQGNDGDDYLLGEDGVDAIFGATGSDYIDGGGGNDNLDGGVGHDSIDGGFGNDRIKGGDGNDQIDGGFGNDNIEGGEGDDKIYGDSRRYSDAVLRSLRLGRHSSDYSAQDKIDGGSGDDLLVGNIGDDVLIGGTGADTIKGSGGKYVDNGLNDPIWRFDTDLAPEGEDNDIIVAGTYASDDGAVDVIDAGRGDFVLYRKSGSTPDDVSQAGAATSVASHYAFGYEAAEKARRGSASWSVGWNIEASVGFSGGASKGWFFEANRDGSYNVLPYRSTSKGLKTNIGGSVTAQFGAWKVDRAGFAGVSHSVGLGFGTYGISAGISAVYANGKNIGTVADIGAGLSLSPIDFGWSMSTTQVDDSIWATDDRVLAPSE